MKRHLLLMTLFFLNNFLLAQNEQYQLAMENFQTHYNAEKYAQIFDEFSEEMQEALPLENTLQFLSGLKSQVGEIKAKEWIGFEQGAYASYKTSFERAVLTVNISLNENNKINGLFIKPYEESSESNETTIHALDDYPKEIAEIIFSKAWHFPNNTQMSIALIRNGKTAYYGIIKRNDTILPIQNQQMVFEIGSLTKVFTSTVLAAMVLEGKVNLTDEINMYYPFSFKNNAKINFEALANHTAGLPRLPSNLDLTNEGNPYKSYGEKELEDYLKNKWVSNADLEKAYVYSNLGTGLLGHTLGLVQKTNFQTLLPTYVFEKFNMKNSWTTSRNLGNKKVKGQNPNGEIATHWDFDVLFGAGGMLSTAEDLAQFALAQFNPKNKELTMTRQPTFSINDQMQIGLGWHLLKSQKGATLFWHNGGTAGYSSSMAIDVEKKNAVIVLSNVSAFHAKNDHIDQLCFALMDELEK